MLCGWGGKRGSGVVGLTMRYRLVLRAKGLQRSPDPLSVFKEPTSKGWEGGRKGRGQAPKYFGLEPPLREKGRENRYDPTCTYTPLRVWHTLPRLAITYMPSHERLGDDRHKAKRVFLPWWSDKTQIRVRVGSR